MDIDGEARLADVLIERGARVLDAGAGMGRVGIALVRRGHDVLAAEPDESLVAQSRSRWPELEVVNKDILELTPATEGDFDLVIAVGNVMILVAEGTEVRVLTALRRLLRPHGRMLIGFHVNAGPPHGRHGYEWAAFVADAEAAGLQVQHRFGGYGLESANDDYCVAILTLQ